MFINARNKTIETEVYCRNEFGRTVTQPTAHIRQDIQQAFGSIIQINTIRKEPYLFASHGRAATHKPFITKFKIATRLRWCKARRQRTVDSGNEFSRAINEDLHSIVGMAGFGFVVC